MKDFEIGSIILFGSHKWRILDVKKNMILIITDEIIERRPYHNVYEEITWADCTLRKYLNGDFYDEFIETDKAKIIPVKNKNMNNQWYGTNGGKETQDKIFLLSIEEVVCKYFGDSSENLLNRSKKQLYWFQKKDKNNDKRVAIFSDESSKGTWWWLRSPGRVGVKAVYIHGNGNIGIQGNNILKGNIADGKCRGGVRPALWLKL